MVYSLIKKDIKLPEENTQQIKAGRNNKVFPGILANRALRRKRDEKVFRLCDAAKQISYEDFLHSIHSYNYLFIHFTFIDRAYLLCAKYFPRHWQYTNEQDNSTSTLITNCSDAIIVFKKYLPDGCLGGTAS